MPIQNLSVPQQSLLESSRSSEGPGFAEVLQGAVETVNALQQEADTAARDFAVGQAQSLHETMIALEKADISLRLLIQVRNKAIDAYQEVMRMQI
jgi:flagellar hook-basal body complex protein FliE